MENKNILVDTLSKNNIETRDCYPALSFQSYLNEFEKTDLSLSESITEEFYGLPSSNNLKKEDIIKISNLINSTI